MTILEKIFEIIEQTDVIAQEYVTALIDMIHSRK